MISAPRLAFAATCSVLLAHAAGAQPTLTVSTNSSANIVIPGKPVTLTLSEPGAAGKQYAFIGSAYGAGFSFAGTQLAVGPDVVVLKIGTLTGTTATLEYTPPFLGTTLDRYYVQAVTSFTSTFSPLLASNGVVIRNGDLVPPTTMGSNTGSRGGTIVAGDNYIMATAAFVVERDQTCLVTTSLQFNPTVVVGNGTLAGYLRNAVRRNDTTNENDGVYGQYVVGTGTSLNLAPITRASVIPVSAGQTIRFGAFFNSEFAGSVTVQTAYICS
jgi:hypothetical protein